MTNPQTALITGATRGLGRALARRLAADSWQLIVNGRDHHALADLERELAPLTDIYALAGDVRDPSHRRALALAAQAAGGLDAVVNNAGALGPSPLPTMLDFPLDAFADLLAVNTIAPLGIVQAVRSTLKPGARVLNISSDAAVEAYEGWGGYGASKAALEQWTAVLAAERPDWRVYHVDPGDMRTAMHQAAFPGEDISDRPLPETSVPGLVALLAGDLPSGRYAARKLTPEPV